jgi:hypothetical protein
MSEKLRLKATDIEDLAVIAACLQDARVTLGEMAYLAAERRFMLAFTRYRRERQKDPTCCEGLTECQSVLVFEGIDEVKHKGIAGLPLEKEIGLLTIATEPGRERLIHIDLVFAGDAQVQLRTDRICCRLDDFGEPVACRVTPCDHFATDFWAQVQHGAST